MSFRKRMIVTFSILIFLVSICWGIIYLSTVRNNYIDSGYQNLQVMANDYVKRFDKVMDTMTATVDSISADSELLEAIDLISRSAKEMVYLDYDYANAKKKVERIIEEIFLEGDYAQIILFMENGVVIKETDYDYNQFSSKKDIRDVTWLDQMNAAEEEYFILGEHLDDWSDSGTKKVISVVRKIPETSCYIEVQRNIREFDEMFTPTNENYDLYIYQGQNLLYKSETNHYLKNTAYSLQSLLEKNADHEDIKGMVAENIIYAASNIQENGIRAIIIENSEGTGKAMYTALLLVSALFLVMMLLFGTLVIILSERLTKPIQKLTAIMEETDIHTLTQSPVIEIENKEMKKMYHSYLNVLERLNSSIQKERLLSELNKQAQFDLLQAQVNPHFLFNVLNVVASRGAMVDDEAICIICSDLAQMLRYSTNVKERYASIKEEVHYLEMYLQLLKYRYEEDLVYDVFLEEKMEAFQIPKMTLQQLVENSITHGYENIERIRKIQVTGTCTDKSWTLTVTDNGTGMSEETKQLIYQKIESLKRLLLSETEKPELQIGGMGLVNTYARLYEIYQEDVSLDFCNLPEGMSVSVTVQIQEEKHGE